jgi:hypothetical protein
VASTSAPLPGPDDSVSGRGARRRRRPAARPAAPRGGLPPGVLARLRAAAPAARRWPSLLAIAAGLALATADGGYATADWPFAGVFLLALLILSARLDPPAAAERSRAIRWALGALLAFCAWSALSALWAAVPEIAWEGAHRTLLYVIVLAVVAARPWSPGDLVLALGLVVVGLVVLAVGVLVTGAGADPSAQFLEGRLAAPVGYTNANAALWLLGLWPALALACRTGLAWPWRAAALGACCLLAEMALLAQSRGSLVGFGAAAVVALLVARDRWRFTLALLVVVGAVALAAGALLHVGDASSTAGLVAAMRAARAAMAWTCGLATILAAAAIVAGRRITATPAERARRARRGHQALAALAFAGALTGLVAIGDPAAWAHARWIDFQTTGYTKLDAGGSRLAGSLGSGRYDFYRVALDQWRAHPLVGIGYENFQVPYLEGRRTDEAPLYAHSLLLGVLAGTGLVGAALLIAALASAAAGVRSSVRRHPEARGLAAGAAAGAAGWLAHGQLDWLWEFPALGIIAFALLGLALRAGAPAGEAPVPQRPASPRRRGLLIAAAALAVLVAGSLTALGAAGRLSSAAYTEASSHAAASMSALELASRLEPLSADPLITRGIIARRAGRAAVAAASLRTALDREPESWFAHLELGMVEAAAGQRSAAIADLARSGQLDPGEAVIGAALDQVRRGAALNANAVESTLLQDMQRRVPALGRG